MTAAKERLFRRAFERFRPDQLGFEAFLQDAAHWLDDYALFMALKEAHGGAPWYDWEPELVTREPRALARPRTKLGEAILYYQFVQYAFARQWQRLREACEAGDVHLIGDLPIFVAHDSADVWARPELFQLDEQGQPTVVAGVPPDYFSETGQLWGNPLYDWEVHAGEKFAWWIARMRATIDRVDLVRLDHFRGFEAYWEVPAGSETAATGRWALGPGTAFLEALREGLGGLPLIAEDLGEITAEVEALRDRFELPGMKILQFAFGGDPGADNNLPHKFINHCVVYTGTHDNDTTVGWFTRSDAATTQSLAAGRGRAGLRPPLSRHRRRRDPLGHDPPGHGLGRRHRDHPPAGHPRPRQLGPDERAGPRRGELGLAAPARTARRAGPEPPGRHDCRLLPLERPGRRDPRAVPAAVSRAGREAALRRPLIRSGSAALPGHRGPPS